MVSLEMFEKSAGRSPVQAHSEYGSCQDKACKQS